MSLKQTFQRLAALGITWWCVASTALAQSSAGGGSKGIPLLQPINPGETHVPVNTQTLPFFLYFNMLYPWVIGMAAGIAVLMTLVGGLQIIMSGGDQGKREAGRSRILWSIGGLVMLAFSTLILRTLNPAFYKE